MTDTKSIVNNFLEIQTRKVRCDESQQRTVKCCLPFSLARTRPSFYLHIDKSMSEVKHWALVQDDLPAPEFYYLQNFRQGKNVYGASLLYIQLD